MTAELESLALDLALEVATSPQYAHLGREDAWPWLVEWARAEVRAAWALTHVSEQPAMVAVVLAQLLAAYLRALLGLPAGSDGVR